MVLERIVADEHRTISLEAQNKKMVVTFLKNYIKENNQEVINTFYPKIQKEFDKHHDKIVEYNKDMDVEELEKVFYAKRLYERVRRMFAELNNYFTIQQDLEVTYFHPNSFIPDEDLGLSKQESDIIADGKILKTLTEEGEKLLNIYRLAQGTCSIKEYNSKDKMEQVDHALHKQYKNLSKFKEDNSQ